MNGMAGNCGGTSAGSAGKQPATAYRTCYRPGSRTGGGSPSFPQGQRARYSAAPRAGAGVNALPVPAPAVAGARGGRGVGWSELYLIQEHKSASPVSKYKKINATLEKSLRFAGLDRIANRLSACHKDFDGWTCKHGHVWARPVRSCQVRLCAFEMRAKAMRLIHRFEPFFEKLVSPKYLVLSERNCEFNDLDGGISRLWAAFTKLRHSKLWRQVRGAIAVLEVTYNRALKTWHPHLNVLFEGPYIVQSELVSAWQRATRGVGRSVWIEKADKETLPELFKYVTKVSDFMDVPDAVSIFLFATRGVRFVRTYGEFYAAELEGESEPVVCPDCGTAEVHRVKRLFPIQVFEDAHGQLRFHEFFLDVLTGGLSPPNSTQGVLR